MISRNDRLRVKMAIQQLELILEEKSPKEDNFFSENIYTPSGITYYFIVFAYGKRYVRLGCEHAQHAVNKANVEFGVGTWTSIREKIPGFDWKELTCKEMREWLREIQS